MLHVVEVLSELAFDGKAIKLVLVILVNYVRVGPTDCVTVQIYGLVTQPTESS